MKFSNFLFPDSASAEDDGRVIDETLREARLTDELGYDVIWLAEHHFDGICAYVDPVSFAAALATATTRAKIGFAVAQMALHHPIRFAEQMAVIDHHTRRRVMRGWHRRGPGNSGFCRGGWRFGAVPGALSHNFKFPYRRCSHHLPI